MNGIHNDDELVIIFWLSTFWTILPGEPFQREGSCKWRVSLGSAGNFTQLLYMFLLFHNSFDVPHHHHRHTSRNKACGEKLTAIYANAAPRHDSQWKFYASRKRATPCEFYLWREFCPLFRLYYVSGEKACIIESVTFDLVIAPYLYGQGLLTKRINLPARKFSTKYRELNPVFFNKILF